MTDDIIVKKIGRLIKGYRKAKHWSQEKLAEKADLNRSYLGEIERGVVSPSLVTVEKIAQALEVSLSELFSEYEASSLNQTDVKDNMRVRKINFNA